MSNSDWYKNEIEIVNEFLGETSLQLAIVEAYDAKLALLIEEQKEVEGQTQSLAKESKEKILAHTIAEMEKVLKEQLGSLQTAKEGYMGEGILATIETVAAVEEGEALGEEALDAMRRMNLLMRKYSMACLV